MTDEDTTGPPRIRQVAVSVLAAMFGVQSNRNRERDFRHGKPAHFVLVGLVATLVFVVALWFAVKAIIALTGA